MAQNDQLLIPDAAKADPKSFELLRVWIANKGQHVSLRVGVWSDPGAWGIMLADLAKHIVNSYDQDEALDRLKTLQRIRAAFDAELAKATDDPTGKPR
jgi:hypothetical protein